MIHSPSSNETSSALAAIVSTLFLGRSTNSARRPQVLQEVDPALFTRPA